MAINYLSNGFSIERTEILSVMQPKTKDRFIISGSQQNINTLKSLYGTAQLNTYGDQIWVDPRPIPVYVLDTNGNPVLDATGQPTYSLDANGNKIYEKYPDGSYKYTGTIPALSLDSEKYSPRTSFKLSKPVDVNLGTPRVFINGFELGKTITIDGVIKSVGILNAGTGFSCNSFINLIDIAETGFNLKNDIKIVVTPHVLDVQNGTIEQELKLEPIIFNGELQGINVIQDGIGYFNSPTLSFTNADGTPLVGSSFEIKISGQAATPDGLNARIFGTVSNPNATVSVEIDGKTYRAVNNKDGTWELIHKAVFEVINTGASVMAFATTKGGSKVYSYSQPIMLMPLIEAIVDTRTVPYSWIPDDVDKYSDIQLPILNIRTGSGKILTIEVLDHGHGFTKPPKLIVKDPILNDIPSERSPTNIAPVFQIVPTNLPLGTQRADEFFFDLATNTINLSADDGLVNTPNPNAKNGHGIFEHDEIVVEFFIDSNASTGASDVNGLLRRLATDLCMHPYDNSLEQPFQLIYPFKPAIDPVTFQQSKDALKFGINKISNTFIIESEKGVDLLSSALNINPDSDFMPHNANMVNKSTRQPQKWRIKFEWDEHVEALRVYIGTKYQIRDDGTVSKSRGREGMKASVTRLPGELCEVYFSDVTVANSSNSTNKAKSSFFVRTGRNMIEQLGSYPLTYRLTVTDHGMAFHILEQGDLDSDLNHAWFVVQRHVDNRSGKWEMEDGYSPVHCIYSPSKIDSKYRAAQVFDQFKWYDIEQDSVGTASYQSGAISFTESSFSPSERYVARNVTSLTTSSGAKKVETPIVIKWNYGGTPDYYFAAQRSSNSNFIFPTPGGTKDSQNITDYVNGPFAFSLLKVPTIVGYTKDAISVFTSAQPALPEGRLPFITNISKYLGIKPSRDWVKSTYIPTLNSIRGSLVSLKNELTSLRSRMVSTGVGNFKTDRDTFANDTTGSLLVTLGFKEFFTAKYNKPVQSKDGPSGAWNANYFAKVTGAGISDGRTYTDPTKSPELKFAKPTAPCSGIFLDYQATAAFVGASGRLDTTYVLANTITSTVLPTNLMFINNTPIADFGLLVTKPGAGPATVTGATTTFTVSDADFYSPDIQAYSRFNPDYSMGTGWKYMPGQSVLSETQFNTLLANINHDMDKIDQYIAQVDYNTDAIAKEIQLIDSFNFDATQFHVFDVASIDEVGSFTSGMSVGALASSLPKEILGNVSGLEAKDLLDILPPKPDNATYFEVYVNGQQIKPATTAEYMFTPDAVVGNKITWLPSNDPGVQQYALDYNNDRLWIRYPLLIGDNIVVKYYLNNSSIAPDQTVLIKRSYDQEFPQMEDINETKAIYRFVVREKDILTPTPIHKLATIHQVDSFAIINPLEQISITSDRTYVYMFPGPLTTNRFLYPNSELDLMCYSSAENSAHTSLIRVGTAQNLKYDHDAVKFGDQGSISKTTLNYRDEYAYPADYADANKAGKNWNMDAMGTKIPRLYQGMLSTLPNGNGMRIFLLTKFGPIRPEFSDIIESDFTMLN